MLTEIPATWLFIVALGLIATMFGLLATVLGWMGNKVYGKLDEMSKSMRKIEVDLHGKISDLDRRVTKVEVRCEVAMKGREAHAHEL